MHHNTSMRKLVIGALMLFFASVEAENLGAQSPGYLISDFGFNGEFGIGVFNVNGSNGYNVLPNIQAGPPPGFNGGCSLNRTLTPLHPSTSQDGSLIAFESEGVPDRLHRVFLMNPDGTGVRQVTFTDSSAPNAADTRPVISPDGTMIAFLSSRNTSDNSLRVYTVNTDGSKLQQITVGDFKVVAVAWSPDSTMLAFSGFNFPAGTCPFPNEGLKIINADGTGEQVVACSRNGATQAIDWSPDGTRIGFEDAFGLAGRDGLGISQISPDGTRLGDITPDQLGQQPGGVGGLHNSDAGAFRYSPDSTILAYDMQSPSGGPQGISFINVDGTRRQDTIRDGNFHHFWWQLGPAIATPTTLTLGPDPLVVGPNFRQQLSPVLKDGAGNILSRSAFGYCSTDGRFAVADQLGLVYSPFAGGPATPLVVTNGGLASNVITALPQATDPAVSFRPATWDFGNRGVATTSASQFITLTYTGNAMLNINTITLIGTNAGDYAFDPGSTCPLAGGGPLMPGDNCTVGVMFSPSDVGTRAAQINVDDDAPGSQQTISLVGTGTMPAAAPQLRSAQR